jgi:hypothetical protein
MPAPLLSMYNGGARTALLLAFGATFAQRLRPRRCRDQATEIMNLSSRSPGEKWREL